MGFTFFRPWGELKWLLDKLEPAKWDLLGCISFEERCVSTVDILKKTNKLNFNRFITVNDPVSDVSDEIEIKLKESEQRYRDIVGLSKVNITSKDLFCAHSEIVESFKSFFENSSENIVIDITCFPKRFFFPFLKLAIKNDNIKNLVVSYGAAEKYAESDLSTDPEPWGNIPLFGPITYPEPEPKHAFVGVGFIPFGLSNLLKDRYSNIPVTFLFPFPPGSQFHNRSWDFLRIIEAKYKFKKEDRILRLNTSDVSDTFDHIHAVTGNGTESAIFAPYGPKPLSIAMAIFSTLTDSPVFYTQPKKYNPNYSEGRGLVNAYLIKQNGKCVYEI